jgi:hypothetical protein
MRKRKRWFGIFTDEKSKLIKVHKTVGRCTMYQGRHGGYKRTERFHHYMYTYYYDRYGYDFSNQLDYLSRGLSLNRV